ncbi:MAG: NAD(P)/FAD-dependent oxidoreductase [Chloroflexota bacterium]
MAQRMAIVGANAAGGSAAATLRSEGFDGDLVLIGEEDSLPYERPPMSKGYLRGESGFENTLLKPDSFYEENDIDVRLGVAVTSIDPQNRTLHLSDGETVDYDRVLIATGGHNFHPPIAGIDLDGVLGLRTVKDADRLRERMADARHAVVVGLGFIGSEVAASLRQMGLDVTAIEAESGPLLGALGPDVSRVMEGVHRDNGVELVLGDAVASFEGDGAVERIVTRSGHSVECDFAVVGLGIRPNTDVVNGTGVELNNGIVVDEYSRTSVDGIYAAGDVANHYHPLAGEHMRVEHWQNAMMQGAAAARSMLDRGEPYRSVHWFWSDQYDQSLQYAGFHGHWDEMVVRGSLQDRNFVVFYLQDGRLRAAAALNRARDLRGAQRIIEAGKHPDREQLRDEDQDLRRMARED